MWKMRKLLKEEDNPERMAESPPLGLFPFRNWILRILFEWLSHQWLCL